MKNKRVNIVTSIVDLNQLQHVSETIDLVEVRADIIGSLALNSYQRNRSKVFVLKSKEEGGIFNGTQEERIQYLIAAAKTYDFVELEGERDLLPEILENIPEQQRRISWEGFFTSYSELKNQLQKYQQIPASCYKIVVITEKYEEAIAVTNLVKEDVTNTIIAYAKGEFSRFSQVLPAFLGAPEVHCDIHGEDLYTEEQLSKIYGLPNAYEVKELYGIVGNPVKNSISPDLHNKAYRELNLPYVYVPFVADNFDEFSKEFILNTKLPVPLKGLTVVSPFKKDGVRFANHQNVKQTPTGEACNGLALQDETWEHFSTDAWGALEALKEVEHWNQKRIAIVGTGGTGQTIAKTLKKQDIALTLVNRTIEKGEKIARELGYPFVPLDDFDPSHFDIIIHATPLGKQRGEVPFPLNKLKHQSLVVDHVYPKTDRSELIKYCELVGIKAIEGKTIAGIQIKKQFESMTNREYPEFDPIETVKKIKIN